MQKVNLERKCWLLLAGFCLLGVAGSVGAASVGAAELTPTQPTLALDFENGVSGVGRGGQVVAPRLEGKAEFQSGKFGQAFKSGPGAGYLYFPAPGFITPQAGTVEMWVQPLDWSGDEKAFHSFFRATGEGELHLYKYHTSDVGLLLLGNDGQPNSRNRLTFKSVDSWKPGEWHHIAATWSPARQELYIDGQRVASTAPLLPRALNKEFLIGDHPFNPAIPRTSQSLIDRVRVYDRVLSPEVIAAHYAGDYDKATPLSDQSAGLDYTVERQEKRLTPLLTLLGADVDTEQTLVDFAIVQGERVVAQQTGRRFNGVTADAAFSTDIAPGEYSLRATLRRENGQSVGAISRPLTIPSLAWMNNTLGEEKKVLPPWTPLKVQQHADGFSVHCWGREYRFGNGALPLQIVAQGQPLLQSPPVLQMLVGGAPLQWTPERAQLKNASDYEADITSRASAVTPQGRVVLETNLHLEYDGLAWLTLKLQAPPNFKPDAVFLDLPVREQNALYRHSWNGALKLFSGALPSGAGVVEKDAFRPAAWLGDHDRGLFCFCESAQFWPNWKSENAFELRRENNAATMRLNLLNGQELPANWSFEFGLQATPVKPLPKDWRKWRFSSAPRPTAVIPWPSDAPDSTRYFGYPEARDPVQYQKMVDEQHAQGRAVIPYSLLNGLSSAAPEWKWFGKEWDAQVGEPLPGDTFLHYTTPTTETWRDFVIWKTNEFIKQYKVDGFYHDLTYAFGWAVPTANTGWFDGKEWQKTYPLRAYRELYRRNYAIVKAANPNSFLMGHNSPELTIPTLAYEDAYLNGETLRTPLKGKNSYMDVMGLDQWRSDYTGRQWGVIPFILPEFDPEHYKQTQPTRGLVALVMLHDTSVWPIWSNSTAWIEMYEALDAFGYKEAEFIPYFDGRPPATTDMKDVYVSVYKHADGRALVVIGNTSKEARSGVVTLDANRIGLPVTGVLSWPDKKPLVQNGDKIEISVPGLDYRLILIGKAP